MSTTRISVTDSGIRLTFVRMSSSSSTASVRGQERHLDRPVGGELGVDQLLDPGAEALGQRVELEVHAGRQRLHVAAGDRHAPLVPDHAAQHVQRGVGAHEPVAPVPVDLAVRPRCPRPGTGAPSSVCHTSSPSLRTSVTRALAAVPAQDAGVVGLAAAGRVEDGAVEGDPAPSPVDGGDHGVERLRRRRAGTAGRWPS